MPDRFSCHVLHRDEAPTVRELPERVDRADIGMAQGRGAARFLLETRHAMRIVGELGGQDFQRNVAGETDLAGEIDLAHPTGADERQDFVRPECRYRPGAPCVRRHYRSQRGD
jgi:hypothetical protein